MENSAWDQDEAKTWREKIGPLSPYRDSATFPFDKVLADL
jgi:hypothetical protein